MTKDLGRHPTGTAVSGPGLRVGRCPPRRLLACGGVVAAATLSLVLALPGAAPAAKTRAGTGTPTIYWGNLNGNTIGAANLDGSGTPNPSFIGPFSNGSIQPVAVDGRQIYWGSGSGGGIGRADLSLMSPFDENLVDGPVAQAPNGIAVDLHHIYWTNQSEEAIQRANLSGGDISLIFINTGAISAPFGIAVGDGHIYWADMANGTIGRANLDGSHVDRNFITGLGMPVGVAVDNQHIYWTDDAPTSPATTGSIWEANLDGTNRAMILSGPVVGVPVQMAVDAHHLYWAANSLAFMASNPTPSWIGRATLTSNGANAAVQLVSPLSTGAFGIAVSVPVASIKPASPRTLVAAQGDSSDPHTFKLSNEGQQDLSVTGVALKGPDADAFKIGSDNCAGSTEAPGDSCQLSVSFTPQAIGERSVRLEITSTDFANSPTTVSLRGLGLPQGSGAPGTGTPGPAGASGPAGAPGPQGPRGPASGTRRVATLDCQMQQSGPMRCDAAVLRGGAVHFVARTRFPRVTVSRGGVTYGSGRPVRMRGGRLELLINLDRSLRRGRYTLTRETRHGSTHSTIDVVS